MFKGRKTLHHLINTVVVVERRCVGQRHRDEVRGDRAPTICSNISVIIELYYVLIGSAD